MDFTKEIRGHTLEYFDSEHLYLVDGFPVPSITQMLKTKFGNKYAGVDKAVLRNAAAEGTKIHEAIEAYCKTGEEADFPEVKNFRFLQNAYKFQVIDNEVPVILFWFDGTPISAGRLDMLIEMDGKLGLADIKRTSALDKEYLGYQLNLYRVAFMQSYAPQKVEFLRGIHLRENVRKFVKIPIEKDLIYEFIKNYLKENKHE